MRLNRRNNLSGMISEDEFSTLRRIQCVSTNSGYWLIWRNVLFPETHSMRLYKYVIYPTLPSRLIASNFCASTANSIGNLFNTSLQ